MNYRLWINAERTILLRMWENGQVEVAIRPEQGPTWGPPVSLKEEKV